MHWQRTFRAPTHAQRKRQSLQQAPWSFNRHVQQLQQQREPAFAQDVSRFSLFKAVLVVKSREAGGQGHANATVTFDVKDGGGTIHTNAQITGKAASMGEGVVVGVLEALINDFTSKLQQL